MHLKLDRLVWITCIALLGIIILQIFWLHSAYEAQQNRLRSTAEETMLETQIMTGVNPAVRVSAQSLAEGVLNEVMAGRLPVDDDPAADTGKQQQLDSALVLLSGGDSASKDQVMQLLGLGKKQKAKTYTLSEFKQVVQKALAKKQIPAIVELALIGGADQIIQATVDTAVFNQATVITGMDASLPIQLKDSPAGRLKMAFPNARPYLLKGIGTILLLSVSLTMVCVFSFSFMLILIYKQKRLSEMKSDFMNNMTHELKTPISSISIALELLQDEQTPVDSSKRKEYFTIAGGELQRLNTLVNRVLRMAAFEKMSIPSKKEQFLVGPLVTSVISSLQPLIDTNAINLKVSIVPEALEVTADKKQMSSVLRNLIENAIKYNDGNKPILNIEILACILKQNFTLSVADNGMGIASKYQSKVFDKFFRVPTGDKHETKGYGLGLSYVQEVAKLHGGKIALTSVVGEGSKFTFSIPQQN